MTERPDPAPRLQDLAWLRRVRDRIDREYAHMSAGHLSRQFRLAYGESPYSYLMTRRIERAYGIRDCAVRNPAGNMLRIQELR